MPAKKLLQSARKHWWKVSTFTSIHVKYWKKKIYLRNITFFFYILKSIITLKKGAFQLYCHSSNYTFASIIVYMAMKVTCWVKSHLMCMCSFPSCKVVGVKLSPCYISTYSLFLDAQNRFTAIHSGNEKTGCASKSSPTQSNRSVKIALHFYGKSFFLGNLIYIII